MNSIHVNLSELLKGSTSSSKTSCQSPRGDVSPIIEDHSYRVLTEVLRKIIRDINVEQDRLSNLSRKTIYIQKQDSRTSSINTCSIAPKSALASIANVDKKKMTINHDSLLAQSAGNGKVDKLKVKNMLKKSSLNDGNKNRKGKTKADDIKDLVKAKSTDKGKLKGEKNKASPKATAIWERSKKITNTSQDEKKSFVGQTKNTIDKKKLAKKVTINLAGTVKGLPIIENLRSKVRCGKALREVEALRNEIGTATKKIEQKKIVKRSNFSE